MKFVSRTLITRMVTGAAWSDGRSYRCTATVTIIPKG